MPLHRIRAGDCLVKMGQKREALSEYRAAADAYLALGMHVHARSAWRLVLGIVPGDVDASASLHALDTRVRGAKAGSAVREADTPTAPESVVRAEKAEARAASELVIVPESVAVEPAVAKALAVTPAPSARERLALEFADLDDDADEIWIELDGLFDEPVKAPLRLAPAGIEETEPVAFFAANDDGDSTPSRKSGPGLGLRASVVDEETKPVPPPEP